MLCFVQLKEVNTVKKTLYSLLLDEGVVRAVDQLAHRQGCSRSAMVNRLLAEQLDLMTPERRIGEVLQALDSLVQPDPELVPFFSPNSLSMYLKSALDYKYRPTVKYEVQLYRSGEDSIGEIGVSFRTQSTELLAAMSRYFRLWQQLEGAYLAPRLGHEVSSAVYEGKFLRAICAPQKETTAEELAQALSAYLHLFDRLLKSYLSGALTVSEIEQQYARYVQAAELLI